MQLRAMEQEESDDEEEEREDCNGGGEWSSASQLSNNLRDAPNSRRDLPSIKRSMSSTSRGFPRLPGYKLIGSSSKQMAPSKASSKPNATRCDLYLCVCVCGKHMFNTLTFINVSRFYIVGFRLTTIYRVSYENVMSKRVQIQCNY